MYAYCVLSVCKDHLCQPRMRLAGRGIEQAPHRASLTLTPTSNKTANAPVATPRARRVTQGSSRLMFTSSVGQRLAMRLARLLMLHRRGCGHIANAHLTGAPARQEAYSKRSLRGSKEVRNPSEFSRKHARRQAFQFRFNSMHPRRGTPERVQRSKRITINDM